MKCPKCGFTSFDYLQECKKCGNDLSEFKSRFNLQSVLFPSAYLPGAAAEGPSSDEVAEDEVGIASAATDFGFDFMGEESAPGGEPSAIEEPSVSLDLEGEDSSTSENGGDKSWFLDPDAVDTEIEGLTSSDESPLPDTSEEESEVQKEDEFLKLDFETSWEDEDLPLDAPEEEDITEPENFDLPSFDDLPALDASDGETEIADLEETDLSSWDFDDSEDPPKKASGEEEPSDPFDHRESAMAQQVPDLVEAAPEKRQHLSDSGAAGAEKDLEEEICQERENVLEKVSSSQEAGADKTPVVQRIAASLLDLGILVCVFLLFVMAGEVALNPDSAHFLPDPELIPELAIPYFMVLFGLLFGYFTLFHYLTGQTIGKMVFHLRVEGQEGEPLAFSQAFLRSAGGLLSLLPVGAGFLWVVLDRQGRGWSDRLAGTRVMQKENDEIAHPAPASAG